MQDLRSLQDERIINGGEARYRGMSFISNPDLILWNLGPITSQYAVTQAIKWGDGSPDPDVDDAVDNVYLVGQSSDDITHYIQLEAFVAGTYVKGDRVAIHTARTTDWGVTDGCNYFDGKTVIVEGYAPLGWTLPYIAGQHAMLGIKNQIYGKAGKMTQEANKAALAGMPIDQASTAIAMQAFQKGEIGKALMALLAPKIQATLAAQIKTPGQPGTVPNPKNAGGDTGWNPG